MAVAAMLGGLSLPTSARVVSPAASAAPVSVDHYRHVQPVVSTRSTEVRRAHQKADRRAQRPADEGAASNAAASVKHRSGEGR
jgi:hypothetical protein